MTHPDAVRYFMTVAEAVRPAIPAGSSGERGELVLLDRGDPISITDLARNMITLSGREPHEEIKINSTGIRPVEQRRWWPGSGPLAALAACYALLTLPFWSRYLHSWDAGNYALGMIDFNVLFDRPQPSGYLLYIGFARILNRCFRDSNQTLVFISWVSGLVNVGFLYLILSYLRVREKFLAVVFFMTIPLVWFHALVAWIYSTHGMLYTIMLYLLLRFTRDHAFRLLLPVVYAFIVGIRSDAALFLLVPVVYVLVSTGSVTGKYPAVFIALFGGACLLWFVPLVARHWPDYFTYTSLYTDLLFATSSIASGSATLAENIRKIGEFATWGLAPYVLVMAAAGWCLRKKENASDPWWWRLCYCFLVPQGLFYLLVHAGRPGHLLGLLPPYFVYLMVVLSNARFRSLRVFLALLIVANGLYFLGTKYPLTRRAIQREDKVIAGIVSEVKENFDPARTLILSDLRYRQEIHYLPEYRVVWPICIRLLSGRYFNFTVQCRGLRENFAGRHFWDDHEDRVIAVAAGTSIVLTDEGLAQKLVAAPPLRRYEEVLAFETNHDGRLVFERETIRLETR